MDGALRRTRHINNHRHNNNTHRLFIVHVYTCAVNSLSRKNIDCCPPIALVHLKSVLMLVLNSCSESHTTRTPFIVTPSSESTLALFSWNVASVAGTPLKVHCMHTVPGGASRTRNALVISKVAMQSFGPGGLSPHVHWTVGQRK